MAHLLDLCDMPGIQDNILSHLRVRDVKALRLTCKATGKWVDNSNVKDLWGGVSATIDLNKKKGNLSFRSLTMLPFAVYELTVLNPNCPSLLNVKRTGKFVETKGAGVKKLYLDYFYGCKYEDEFTFMKGLSGLQELKVGHFELDRMDNSDSDFDSDSEVELEVELEEEVEELRLNPHGLPDSIRYLRTFEYRFNTILESCPEIWEFLSSTRFTTILMPPFEEDRHLGRCLQEMLRIVRGRRFLENEAKTNYTHIDLTILPNWNINRYGFMGFAEDMRHFFSGCRANSVKVLNVPPFLLIDYFANSEETTFVEGTLETVESIWGWDVSLPLLRSPNIKELRMEPTSQKDCNPLSPKQMCSWPNLEILRVSFLWDSDTDDLRKILSYLMEVLGLGLDCLSLNDSGLKVTEMELTFPPEDKTDDDKTPLTRFCGNFSSCSLVRRYPNVKILKITRWDGEDFWWAELWKGLHHLEELHIVNCSKLGDEGFISSCSTEQSPFLKLKNLKKLTLNLNNMPRISDRLFRDVIAHISLDEFYLHTKETSLCCKLSNLGLSQVETVSNSKLSKQALEYLADGTFGRSVKKFPFKNIALKDTTDEELQKLKFRFPRAHF